ncbi:MAG: acetaldehyde dehydrogenase (acetylating) [Ignavibacteria bacterium RBG_13_36_8]|nr:MAG: acetaldehyde dehydrogenase (acetylating) [Ignavibacteria bacterium RBG_13_36_8]
MTLDRDLQSVQEVRELTRRAKEAQLEFKHFNQTQVDKIIKAIADAGFKESERLAKIAYEETGFGKWQDKVIKNQFATKNVYNSIKDLKTVGIIDIQKNGKIVKIAEPMGVVAALIPSTNPTSTAMFKTIISLKCRNSIVCSPHPKAINSIQESLHVLREAAEKAGAPKDLILCMTIPTLEGTNALMKDDNIAIILATGSTPMVKAAYSSGKPAYGVGPGNVPAFIERTANYQKATADIIYGTTFDNGTLCSSEQSMIVDRPLKDKVIEEAIRNGAYFANSEEKKKLENALVKKEGINPEIVGKPAPWIANYAGFSIPDSTTVLIAECQRVGKEEPMSIEKLSPTLAFYVVDGWLDGCHKCIELLEFGGVGHTMVLHSNDKEIIMKFALEKPAFRILVNTPSSVGAVGYTTALNPSFTLGPGTWGGSIVSENVTAHHLMNIKTLAFEVMPINKGQTVSSLDATGIQTPTRGDGHFISQIEERLRARAGNPNVPYTGISKSDNMSERKAKILGKGITEEEIQKIIKEFNL